MEDDTLMTTYKAGLFPSPSSNEEGPLMFWHKNAAIAASIMAHVLLLAFFLDFKSHKQPPVEQAGNSGSAFSVVLLTPTALQTPLSETAEPEILEPVIRTVVSEKAEIVVQQKKVATLSPAEKKTVTSRPQPRRPSEKERMKQSTEIASSQKINSDSSSTTGTKTSNAKTIQEGSGGITSQTGESTSGKAEKGAGTTNSTVFKILNRRVNYPTRARSMGVEGRVKIQFDVSASGTIKNIRILAEDPPEVFSRELRQDILRWRYDTTGELKDQTVTVIFKIDGNIRLIN